MGKPTILTVDDDPAVCAAISRDLGAQYGAEYRVVAATSGEQALTILARRALRDQRVALIITDQRMPDMTGVDIAPRPSSRSTTSVSSAEVRRGWQPRSTPPPRD